MPKRFFSILLSITILALMFILYGCGASSPTSGATSPATTTTTGGGAAWDSMKWDTNTWQ